MLKLLEKIYFARIFFVYFRALNLLLKFIFIYLLCLTCLYDISHRTMVCVYLTNYTSNCYIDVVFSINRHFSRQLYRLNKLYLMKRIKKTQIISYAIILQSH